MEKSYQKLLQGNKHFAETRALQDPDFFKKLVEGQKTGIICG
jgi:carbonic anhydrase